MQYYTRANFLYLHNFVGGARTSPTHLQNKKMEVSKVGECVVIRMNLGENRFNPESVKAFHEALDKAER